jgi:RimJ/RimL family protein N-acetyltransferase
LPVGFVSGHRFRAQLRSLPGTQETHVTNLPKNAIVSTVRLELIPWDLTLIDAMVAGDGASAARAIGAAFPDPFAPPPETGDVLGFFREKVAEDASGGLFAPRMIVRAADRVVLGSLGVMAPDADGRALTGWGVYPVFERNGYASEAARSLLDHVLEVVAGVTIVATIRIGHEASEKVATRAGMIKTDEVTHEDGMTLAVWKRNR